MKQLLQNRNVVICFVLMLFLYFPLFLHLQKESVFLWDESRLAWNAIEMSKNNNFIVTYFEGKPDLWNTKPPLLVVLQALNIKVLGVNELALRLPSAIAAFITCIVLFYFLKKQTNQMWLGFFAAMILVTSQGYVNYHCSRTGDYDSLLILFTTLFCLSFFNYLHTKQGKYLKLFFGFLTLAILTKGIQPLIFIPGLLIYFLSDYKEFRSYIRIKPLMFYGFLCVGLTLGYYLLRESLNPGFLKAVFNNEVGGRYLSTIEGHLHPFSYYFDLIREVQFQFWFIPMIFGIIIGWLNKNKKIKMLTVFSLTMILPYLLIISNAQTKLEWYDLPVFPFLALLAAIAINELFLQLKNIPNFSERLTINVIPYLLMFMLFLIPYQAIINKVYSPKRLGIQNESIPLMLKRLPPEKKSYAICWDNGYGPHINFYIEVLANKGITCYYKYYKDLEPGDIAIASQDHEKNYIEKEYKNTILLEKNAAKMYKIERRN